jgi:BirA family transcriptional regulator, biotin operon repressor / biotin---[acetyl-CoA-carboxylase] ligase
MLPEDLAGPRVAAALSTRRLGRRYRLLATCASTSDEVMSEARAEPAGEEGLVVAADTQTGGRGRQGRLWHSPPGENLYFSLLLRPDVSAGLVPPLTLLVGAVLAEVVAAAGAHPRLKWPNDLLLPTAAGLRKAGGILTEMGTLGGQVRQVVVGVGLNVHAAAFPPDLADRATSLRLSTGRSFDRAQLLAALLNALEPAYDRFVDAGPAEGIARWRALAALGLRCRIERDGGIVEGNAVDVDEDGALLVRDDRGALRRVLSGEVS